LALSPFVVINLSFFILESGIIIILGAERRRAIREWARLVHQEHAARSAAEFAEKRSLFLAEASTIMATSRNISNMLHSIAKICTSFMADWCGLFLTDYSQNIRLESIYHNDRAKLDQLTKMYNKYPVDLNSPYSVVKVIKKGKSELVEEVSQPELEKIAIDDSHLKQIQKIGLKSSLIVPLKTSRGVLGAIQLARSSNHFFDRNDLLLAEELARRMALAVENVMLYESAKNEIESRIKIEDELRRSRDQLRVILESVAEGITVQNVHGKLIFANEAAAKMIGYESAEQLIQSSVSEIMQNFELIGENGRPYPPDKLPGRLALQGFSPPETILGYRTQESHEERWTNIKATPIFSKNGQVQFAINIFRDVTEIRNQELKKDEFIAIASHELKSPLTVIKAYTQTLVKRISPKTDAVANKYLVKMDEQINRLTDLIKELLDVTRIRVGKLDLMPKKIQVDDLIMETLESLKKTVNHQLVFKTPVHKTIYADPQRISQVLTNLIFNAVKYSPESQKIIIHCEIKNYQVVISVKDFGIGISPRDQNRIFDRFYQIGDPRARMSPGLGLGLYIAAQIIKAHHGKIWVDSVKGKGSTFSFSLPLNRNKPLKN
jgi:signal transduction histidine kinase